MLEEGIRELAELKTDPGIVSVYIKLDPKLRYRRKQAAVKFQSEAVRFARAASGWQLEALDREKPNILTFLKSQDFLGRTLAIFSSKPAGVWRVLRLDVMVPTTIAVDKRAQVQPLVRLLDENPRVVVCVIERDRAAVYTVEGGTIRPESDIESVVPGWHDQGGWSQARFQRHIEFHAGMHMDKVVAALEEAAAGLGEASLFIGGVEDVTVGLMKRLPESLKRRHPGTFHVDFKHETTEEIMERARRLWVEAERRSEVETIEGLAADAGAGGRAVLGAIDTTAAVSEGRVRELVVADGAEASGYECTACGFLAAKEMERCPACDRPMERVEDLVDMLIGRAYVEGIRTESVFGEARHELLALGGIAARLRY
ncbi:MAG TPA: Vms1/Ankzf1 family peptidyl-tRNA hydrolase [Dehalococcoidia bacterium]|nr:Vms1/Ankzf1 family peptidyl-tRNA hydrolase [Dehalococcoidia bacterium]